MRQRTLAELSVKEQVRQRDGYRCVDCGMTQDEHIRVTGRKLDVHRRNPGEPYTVEGCETLCRLCHGPKPKSERQGPLFRRGRLFVKLSREVKTALDAYLGAARPQPTTRAVIETALQDFLAGHGFWPPPADK